MTSSDLVRSITEYFSKFQIVIPLRIITAENVYEVKAVHEICDVELLTQC